MNYEIVITQSMAGEIRKHFQTDPSREQLVVTLCGIHKGKEKVRLLGRYLIIIPEKDFSYQTAGGLSLNHAVHKQILRLAAMEGLSQVDWHSHPGNERNLRFSETDNESEREIATYLNEKLSGTIYGSVLLNEKSMIARVWEIHNGIATVKPTVPPELDKNSLIQISPSEGVQDFSEDRYDRQIRAFGRDLQIRLSKIKVGLIGLGGIGSIIAEQLARLGIRNWVLVDPDILEVSNLNRIVSARLRDVEAERLKVELAARNIRQINPEARIKTLKLSVCSDKALKQLKECDLLIAATDNNSSRLVLNALACQYLIPLVHTGVNLEIDDKKNFKDISGEVAITELGSWCLLCSEIIDTQRASWELASPGERSLLIQRGYLEDTPAPAVYHLNSIISSLAVTEIHNLIWPYKPLRRYQIYRELEGEIINLDIPQMENCMHCGVGGLLGLGDLSPVWSPNHDRDLPSSEPIPLTASYYMDTQEFDQKQKTKSEVGKGEI